MTISVRQLTGAVCVSFCVGAFIAPVVHRPKEAPRSGAIGAAAKQPTYMVVEFMKVPEGKEDAWLKLERENVEADARAPRQGGVDSVMVRNRTDDAGR